MLKRLQFERQPRRPTALEASAIVASTAERRRTAAPRCDGRRGGATRSREPCEPSLMDGGGAIQISLRRPDPSTEKGSGLLARLCEGIATSLTDHGVEVERNPHPLPVGGGAVEPSVWVIGVATPIAAFFTALASEAGKDAWRKLKDLLEDLRSPAGEDVDVLTIKIWIGGKVIVIPEDMPDEAYEELMQLVASGEGSEGPKWDPEARKWRPR
jgi:hypothetical protein